MSEENKVTPIFAPFRTTLDAIETLQIEALAVAVYESKVRSETRPKSYHAWSDLDEETREQWRTEAIRIMGESL